MPKTNPENMQLTRRIVEAQHNFYEFLADLGMESGIEYAIEFNKEMFDLQNVDVANNTEYVISKKFGSIKSKIDDDNDDY